MAYSMRNTLKELNLHQSMLPLKDLERLSVFTQLTKIDIGQRVLENVYGLGQLLQYLPNLVSLHVGEFPHDIGQLESNNSIAITPNNRLKELAMTSYMPNSDKEFSYLMEIFPAVGNLEMCGYARDLQQLLVQAS